MLANRVATISLGCVWEVFFTKELSGACFMIVNSDLVSKGPDLQPSPEIIVDRKPELLDKELLVGRQIILLIKENHRLFIVDRFDASVR